MNAKYQTSLYDSNPTSRSVADPAKSGTHFECSDNRRTLQTILQEQLCSVPSASHETEFFLARHVTDDCLHDVCDAAVPFHFRWRFRCDHPEWNGLRRHRRGTAESRCSDSR